MTQNITFWLRYTIQTRRFLYYRFLYSSGGQPSMRLNLQEKFRKKSTHKHIQNKVVSIFYFRRIAGYILRDVSENNI